MHQEDTLYKIQIENLSLRENVTMLKAEKIKERCSTCCHSPTGYTKNDSSTLSAFCCSKCEKTTKTRKEEQLTECGGGGKGVTLQWKLIFCIRNGRWCCTAALCRGCSRLFRQFHLPAVRDMLCLYCSGHTHTHKYTGTHTSAVMFNMRHSHGIQMTKTCDQSCYRAVEQFVQIC